MVVTIDKTLTLLTILALLRLHLLGILLLCVLLLSSHLVRHVT